MKLKFVKNLPLNFCFFTLMMLQLTFAERIELFKGEISLRLHLQRKLCGVKSFVLIENFRFYNDIAAAAANISVRPQIDRVLARTPNCAYRRYENVNMRQLNEQLPTFEPFFHFQFIFDLSNFRIANRSTFAQVLQEFGQFYEYCSACSPFLVLFDHSFVPQRLFEWSMFAQSLVPSTFQSALIADLDSTMVTVLWRPVLDGCRSTEPIFWPQSVTDFERLNVHFRDCNLGSITLNVSVNQIMPICAYTRDQANNRLISHYSVEIEFLKILATHYNFNYRLIDGKQVWGMFDQANGTWNGVIGHVINGISNMALCNIIRTISRYPVIDFTTPTLYTGVTFIAHNPKRMDPVQLILPTVLTPTFLGLVFVFTLLFLMMSAILRRSHSYISVLEMFYAIAMRQSENKLMLWLRTDSSRLLCASWLITMVIVYNFYSIIIFAILTVVHYEPAFDTINDLVREVNADRCQIVVIRNSVFHQEFLHSGPENQVLYAIGRHLNRTKSKGLCEPSKNIIQYVEENRNRVGISSRYYLLNQRNVKATKPLYIGSENIWYATTGVALPKRSPLLYPFNHVIVKLHENGYIIYWLRSTGLLKGNKNNEAIFQNKPISVQETAWFFDLYLYINLICAIVLLFEIGVWQWF